MNEVNEQLPLQNKPANERLAEFRDLALLVVGVLYLVLCLLSVLFMVLKNMVTFADGYRQRHYDLTHLKPSHLRGLKLLPEGEVVQINRYNTLAKSLQKSATFTGHGLTAHLAPVTAVAICYRLFTVATGRHLSICTPATHNSPL